MFIRDLFMTVFVDRPIVTSVDVQPLATRIIGKFHSICSHSNSVLLIIAALLKTEIRTLIKLIEANCVIT